MSTDLSIQPDPHMRWIYDYNDPRYNDLAFSNDMRRKNERNDKLRSQGRVPEL